MVTSVKALGAVPTASECTLRYTRTRPIYWSTQENTNRLVYTLTNIFFTISDEIKYFIPSVCFTDNLALSIHTHTDTPK